MTEQEFQAGHVFFRPGDPAERAFLVIDGEVEVVHGPADGGLPVARLGPGGVFGEMSLVQERPHAGTARALTPGRAGSLTGAEFEHLLTSDPARCREYLRSLFERLRTLTSRLAGDSTELVPVGAVEPPVPHGPVELAAVGAAAPLSRWSVVLYPLTPWAAATLPEEGLKVTRLPLRIGRAHGAHEPPGLALNDVWLLDGNPYTVSRNHCELDANPRGVIVRDRGSHLGCTVNGQHVGGGSPLTSAWLRPGDNLLVLGPPASGYQFRVSVSAA
jgi:hypothetical protein